MMRDADAIPPACVQCGATDESVVWLSPDMDIKPVPLCLVCRFTLYSIGRAERLIDGPIAGER